LADHVAVGEPDAESVLRRVVLVLVLARQALARVVVRLACESSAAGGAGVGRVSGGGAGGGDGRVVFPFARGKKKNQHDRAMDGRAGERRRQRVARAGSNRSTARRTARATRTTTDRARGASARPSTAASTRGRRATARGVRLGFRRGNDRGIARTGSASRELDLEPLEVRGHAKGGVGTALGFALAHGACVLGTAGAAERGTAGG
jgi:hypothetical protein